MNAIVVLLNQVFGRCQRIIEQRFNLDVFGIKRQFAGFDARQIEYIVDQVQ